MGFTEDRTINRRTAVITMLAAGAALSGCADSDRDDDDGRGGIY